MAFGLCRYKNLFGKHGEGLRKYRIFNIAIYDTIVVIVIVWFLSWLFKWPFYPLLAFVFILGIFVHRAFCVRTGLDKMLFPNAR